MHETLLLGRLLGRALRYNKALCCPRCAEGEMAGLISSAHRQIVACDAMQNAAEVHEMSLALYCTALVQLLATLMFLRAFPFDAES